MGHAEERRERAVSSASEQRRSILVLWFPDLVPLARKVIPIRILGLDERDLLRARPPLELFFARDCNVGIVEEFEVNEAVHVVAGSEAAEGPKLVLAGSFAKASREADVERLSRGVGHDVDGEHGGNDTPGGRNQDASSPIPRLEKPQGPLGSSA